MSALHFTREIFIAITAFVMVYGYVNRPFRAKAFWRKRGLGVLLPYVLWSLFYEVASKPHRCPPAMGRARAQRYPDGRRLVSAVLHSADAGVLPDPPLVSPADDLGGKAPLGAAGRQFRGAGGHARAGLPVRADGAILHDTRRRLHQSESVSRSSCSTSSTPSSVAWRRSICHRCARSSCATASWSSPGSRWGWR